MLEYFRRPADRWAITRAACRTRSRRSSGARRRSLATFGVLSRAGLACPGGGKRIPRLLTLSEALCQRRQHFRLLANQFGAWLVDMSGHSVVVEVTGKTARVQAFLVLVKVILYACTRCVVSGWYYNCEI
ncbi:hypothetical protein EI94DRAFT_1748578, partial [Lactarius quietus]